MRRSSYTRRKFRFRYECATRSERNAAANNCTSPIGGLSAAGSSFLPASSSLVLKRKRVHLLKKNNTENSIKVNERASFLLAKPSVDMGLYMYNDGAVDIGYCE